MNALIGNDCFVGPFVEIQKGVVIGDRCKIQSHSFICELVTIGNDCFIGHGVMFVNDTFQNGKPAAIPPYGNPHISAIMFLSAAMQPYFLFLSAIML
jgi:UDP-3-O-[3-hydroxymyristoyl] glucosamine N-acyltransferase